MEQHFLVGKCGSRPQRLQTIQKKVWVLQSSPSPTPGPRGTAGGVLRGGGTCRSKTCSLDALASEPPAHLPPGRLKALLLGRGPGGCKSTYLRNKAQFTSGLEPPCGTAASEPAPAAASGAHHTPTSSHFTPESYLLHRQHTPYAANPPGHGHGHGRRTPAVVQPCHLGGKWPSLGDSQVPTQRWTQQGRDGGRALRGVN